MKIEPLRNIGPQQVDPKINGSAWTDLIDMVANQHRLGFPQ